MKYMIDTNAFDYFIENAIRIQDIQSKGELYTSNVQFSELSNNPNDEHREKALALYEELDTTKLQLESGLWLDNIRWDDDQIWHDSVGEGFESALGNSRGHYDAMIGELVLNHNLILVTNDRKFTRIMARNEATIITVEEFLNL